MTAKLNIAIAAGGTAGHVNPALALAEELRSRGHNVRFFGETNRLEGRLVPQAGFAFHPINVTGFDRQRPWTLITALVRLAREERRLVHAFQSDAALKPDVAIGFGAYVELPLVRAAAKLGIPYALHEQNSVPGLANKQAARHASLIAIAQPSVATVFEHEGAKPQAIAQVGNPVRPSVLAGDRARGRAALGVPEDTTLLLVFGGSLGAHHLNMRMAALKDELLTMPGVYVVHATGAEDFEATKAALALTPEQERRYQVLSYIENMGDMLAAARPCAFAFGCLLNCRDCRSCGACGARALSLCYGRPPTTNARFLVDAGAAVMFADASIDDAAFAQELTRLLSNKEARTAMRRAAQGLGQDQAAVRLADRLEALVA